VDRKHWAGPKAFWNALAATHKGYVDLPAHRQSAGRAAKIESTVRYLGIEVDDALAIAEQVDI
jgi:hypothetical protein